MGNRTHTPAANRPSLAGLIALAVLTGGLAPVQAQSPAAVQQARTLATKAGDAYRANDLETSAVLLERALALRPNHPVLLYDLASVRAELGDEEDARRRLREAARLGLAVDAARDPSFRELREDAELIAVMEQLGDNGLPKGNAEVAFTIDDPDFLAEGIAHDGVTGRFFVGGVHRRAIAMIDPEGRVTMFGQPDARAGVAPVGPELLGVMGMAVDETRRALWVATAAVEEAANTTEVQSGLSEVRRYDLNGGRMIRSYRSPAGTAHTFGDLAIEPRSGTVYVSDAEAGALFMIEPTGDSLAVLLPTGSLDSPQGIVVAPDGRSLFVADYGSGVWRVDLVQRESVLLVPPRGSSTIGIDGLAADGDALIAVQNYPTPHRVLRLRLSKDRTAIERAEILLSAHPSFDEPTLGTVVGGEFYLVANSQWRKFAPTAEAADRTPPIILKLDLAER